MPKKSLRDAGRDFSPLAEKAEGRAYYKVVAHVYCDGAPSCWMQGGEYHDLEAADKEGIHRLLTEHGWKLTRSGWRCPHCQKREHMKRAERRYEKKQAKEAPDA
jgi:hypothetical protein